MSLPIVVFWLVISQSTVSPYHGGGMTTIPFDSKEKCEEAAKQIKNRQSVFYTEAFCLEDSMDIPGFSF